MANDTNLYKINNQKLSLFELVNNIENYYILNTNDFPMLWEVAKDYLTVISVDCEIYKESKIIYRFDELNDREQFLIKMVYCENEFAYNYADYLEYSKEFEYLCTKTVEIGFLTSNFLASLANKYLFDKATINKFICTAKQYEIMLKYVSFKGMEFLNYHLPTFTNGENLIFIEH